MGIEEPVDEEAFRAEVAAFLRSMLDDRLRAIAARQSGLFAEGELQHAIHSRLYEKGWVAPSWPQDHGGPGWTARQREIFHTEYARSGLPRLPSFGLNLCAPVVMRFGTAAQKAFFLPRILSNEAYFCQGYSEPGAGSDLASLGTHAERVGDHYVVRGAKIWTTHAHYANWIFMLVRTSTEGRRQAGITFLLAAMDSPGITVRPILSISGDHEVNEVFFDEVSVPVANRIGEENEGWTVAKNLLEFERGGAPVGAQLVNAAERLKKIAAQMPDGYGGNLLDDPYFRRNTAMAEIEVATAAALDWRFGGRAAAGQSIGDAGASMKKLMSSEKSQLMTELMMGALGPYAAPSQRGALNGGEEDPIGFDAAATPTAKYFNDRAKSIFGGASEIQRNILAKILGL